MGVCKVNYR